MKLYSVLGCPFAHRAAIALREKGLPFETVFFTVKERPPELVLVGPRAKSPTLFDGDARIWDSTVVLEYLEDRTPAPALLPPAAADRAAVRMMMTRISEELGGLQGPVVREFLAPTPDPSKLEAARDALRAALASWDQLVAGRAFLVGEAFSLADIALFTLLGGAERVGVPVGPERPHLRAWLDRTKERGTTALPSA